MATLLEEQNSYYNNFYNIEENDFDVENAILIPHLGEFKLKGRYVYEPAQLRPYIKNYILKTLASRYENKPIPLLGNKYTLYLSNFEFGKEPEETTRTLFDALENKKSLVIPLYAHIKIIDNETGKTLYSHKKLLANVPYATNQGLFILNGTKYILVNQLRLKPGVYFRVKTNGLPEATINSVDARELVHRYVFDPNTLKFTVQIGQGSIPIYVWLKYLGATDDEIRYVLGDEIFQANYTKASPQLIWSKIKNRFAPYTSAVDDPQQAVQESFQKLNLDPVVTKHILGYETKGLSKEIVFDILRKLIDLNRGQFKPYDKDDLAFKYVYGPEDLLSESLLPIPERITFYLRKLPYSTHKDFSKILPAGFMTKDVMNFFYNSGLGMNPDEYNPTEIYDIFSKVTVMGRGGISNPETVTTEARNIHPSYLGFIDPIRTPEKNVGVDMRFASGVIKRGRTIYSLFINAKNKKMEWLSPEQLINKTIGFPESLYLPDEYVPAIKNRTLMLVPKKEIDYVLPSMYSMFSTTVNLIPLNNASFAHRLSMGAKMTQQALPLVKGEAPLVQNAIKPNYGWADYFGKYSGAVFAENDGVVEKIDRDHLVVKYRDGTTKTYNIWHMLPTNRETFYLQQPVVQVGQKVKKGDLLIKSNFTDDKGTLAIGLNLRTAYVPYWGYTFEDAFVVSESAAKKLSSQYLFQEDAVQSPDFIIDKKRFVGLFPMKFTIDQLNKLDDDGVIKEGQILRTGDPIILGFNDPSQSAFWAYGREFRLKPSDVSITWDKSYEGKVIKVIKDPKKKTVRVFIKADAPLQVGDKLSGLYGDKGVVSAIIPDDQMPRDEEGRPFEVIENPFALFRRNPSLLLAGWYGLIAEKRGKPYYINFAPDKMPDLYEDVKREADRYGVKLTQTIYDPVANKHIPNVSVGNRYFYKLKFTSESKSTQRSFGGYTMDDVPTKGGEYGCLHPDTKILCKNATDGSCLAPFISVNDEVLSIDFKTKQLSIQKVTETFKYQIPNNKIYLVIKTNLGQKVIVSKQHQFYDLNGNKIEAHNLKPGDYILSVRILPNYYQLHTILLLAAIYPIKVTDDLCQIYLNPNLPGSLVSYLSHILKPYAITKHIKVKKIGKKSKLILELQPHTYFVKMMRKISIMKLEGRLNFIAKSLQSMFGICLLVALCGKTLPNGNVALELPKSMDDKLGIELFDLLKKSHSSSEFKFIKKEITKPVSSYRKRRYFVDQDIVLGYKTIITFDKSLSEYAIMHFYRYFLPGQAKDNSVAMLVSKFAKNQPFNITMTIRNIFDKQNYKLSNKEINKIYIMPVKIASIEKYKPEKDYENWMYDFTVSKTHNYITSDWLVLSNSKRVGLLNTYGLLAHGATEVLRDTKLIKGQRNDAFWTNFVLGLPTPQPDIPLIYQKFINYLKGAGINVVDTGKAAYLMPLTDSEIDKLAKGRYIVSEKILTAKDNFFKPVPGGLFDENLTGGLDGRLWSAIKLPFPVLNPAVEDFVIKLLGLTENEYLSILKGEKALDANGSLYDKENFYKATGKLYSGPEGLYQFFKRYDLKKNLRDLRTRYLNESDPDKRSRMISSLIFLETLNKYDIHPSELFWTKVPVVPPIFRPAGIIRMGATKERSALISDVNTLYSDLIRIVKNYEELKGQISDLGEEILDVRQAVHAIAGLDNPVSRRAIQKNVSGLLKQVFSKQPKTSMMQYYLLSTPVDVVGRSVIVPDPNLKLDEVGLPEKVLWEVYRPFIIRRMVRKGIPKSVVVDEFEKRSDRAREALLEELEYRPVIIDRAPLLHKFGMLAFWPKITPGFVMRINPLVTAGFGADFDGDTMNYHVPVSEEARLEAIEKMLPSKNIIQPRTYQAQPVPSKDFAAGIFIASRTTQPTNKPVKIYSNLNDLLNDLEKAKIDPEDPIILNQK